ncbi:putative ankyrin repeat protein RF_0381 isoform X1 [Daphnia pulicaria]|uniref:putative ankyrin repeat protein RF_0381 isoform X1 n=1 Tax=Daphnia pulicaria TaxID=35523 RepID=UPI001EEC6761|nr:putative ankyrin repeat protein RF_0381 isoform X1 [Daphnia pulicaria]
MEFDSQVRLGRGDFGSVFSGTFEGREVAIRRIELIDASDNEEDALKQLDHPNIIKLFHVECNKDFKFIALEFCEASLDKIFLDFNHPRKYIGPKLPYHFEVFSQLASGLEYIHSKNLIHRDIKPEHVLISVDTNRPDIKVTMKWAGFGRSRTIGCTKHSGVKGTKCWYAPELLQTQLLFGSSNTIGQNTGTVESDVFALGLVFAYLLLDGQHIYGFFEIDIPKNISEGRAINMNKIERSHYAYDLVTEMLKNKPDDRISSLTIVERLKAIQVELTEKEKEMFTLCKMRETETVLSLFFPWTHPNEKIKTLIRRGVDVNAKDSEGSNALHLLCQYNSSERLFDAIKLLIQLRIDVNEKDKDGSNALHLLCQYNSSERLIDAMTLLIDSGIEVDEKVKDGDNALHMLCRYNSSVRIMDAIKLLIQRINVNEKNHNGINALHFLCANNSNVRLIDAMTLLIQFGIDVNEKNNNGDNALHMLCYNNSSDRLIDAIKLLIQHITDVNEKDENGSNALHLLCFNNSSSKLIEAINLLIEKKIDVHGKTNYGSNALHLLCRNNTSERLIDAIELLIDFGIEVNGEVIDGDNALHLLCRYNSSVRLVDAIKLLIRLKIDVNGKNKDGDTALHLLCRYNPSERLRDAIELLIKFKIDVNMKNVIPAKE